MHYIRYFHRSAQIVNTNYLWLSHNGTLILQIHLYSLLADQPKIHIIRLYWLLSYGVDIYAAKNPFKLHSECDVIQMFWAKLHSIIAQALLCQLSPSEQ